MTRVNDARPKAYTSRLLDHPDLQVLEDHWQSLRGPTSVPQRKHLNPAKIEAVLPATFILQRVATGTARFRMAGRSINDLLRMDARGMPFSTLFKAEAQDDIRHLMETAFQSPAIVGLPLASAGGLLRPELDAAVLLLPMVDNAGLPTRLLGALVTSGGADQKPRRFTISEHQRKRIEPLGSDTPATLALVHHAARQAKRPDAATRPALSLVVNNG